MFKRRLVTAVTVLMAMGFPIVQAQAKTTLFGDFTVAGLEEDRAAPQTFLIVLESIGGIVLGRQTLTSGGRYRFLDVPNGEYVLKVFVENREIGRLEFLLSEVESSYLRRDLAFQWKTKDAPSNLEVYARSNSASAKLRQARDSMRSGDLKKADVLLNEILGEDPEDYEAWTDLGAVSFRLDRLGRAEECYLRAVELRPDDFLAVFNLGKVRFARKQYEEAVDPFSQAVVLDADSAEAHYLLGESLLQVKKGSKAVVHLNEAIRLQPQEMADAHLRLGTLYRAAGMTDKAVAEFEQYLEKRPDAANRKQLEGYIKSVRNP